MHIHNINEIKKSRLWNRITRNKSYRGSIVINTDKDNFNGFQALYVFFSSDSNIKTLKKYYHEGKMMIRNEGLTGGIVHDGYNTIIEYS